MYNNVYLVNKFIISLVQYEKLYMCCMMVPRLQLFVLIHLQGIIHPVVARIIWSDQCDSLSPYRFCEYSDSAFHNKTGCGYNCTTEFGLGSRLYILDFAGGGAVHLIGMCVCVCVCVCVCECVCEHACMCASISFTHLTVGGMAGLMICLFAKFQYWRDERKRDLQVCNSTNPWYMYILDPPRAPSIWSCPMAVQNIGVPL